MCFGFSYIGLIWVIMLLVPNFIWTKNKPKDYEQYVGNENKLLLLLERTGEFIVTPAALFFTDYNFKGFNFWGIVLLLSFIMMILYEIFWIRYFKSEKTMKDFYSSILGIPVAGATLPVIAFFLLGIYGGNILMLMGTMILGIGHIGIHLSHQREVYGPKEKKPMPFRILSVIITAVCVMIFTFICGAFVFFIACRNINQLKHFTAYKMPVLLISGSCDWICPVGLVEEYKDHISAPDISLILMEGCGHSPQIQLPEDFAGAVKKFLMQS